MATLEDAVNADPVIDAQPEEFWDDEEEEVEHEEEEFEDAYHGAGY